ncbi:unnamed protein product [Rotaria socialis]|uniref:AIG1-type G domain-containing protein n=1 Tax=Rotaria socialis TaxID=392032 RepID=A0A819AJ45_9BILA|nr:unnamed protein product [Rotaria socialis]CAF3608622.1 unnamed protein product [Rotaria socialis]CAF3778230.1 unnamed protein product [Rotaria socialis]CAF4514344.1 unnamed protein product [Rotaria socialis]CAF4601954.1 unnamed protein product [Rotaria socialis]
MAEIHSGRPNDGVGIIILGNSGSGKSFLCNILLDEMRFRSEYDPNAVTVKTERAEIKMGEMTFSIFNIPGLIESDQQRIDQNKKEIEKAFQMCPYSIVIYVWTPNSGGRVVADDGIGFSALHKAYQFPSTSIIYVINNVLSNRKRSFDVDFLVQIKEALTVNQLTLTPDDSVFVEKINFDDKQERQTMRKKIINCIAIHSPAIQEKKADIILETAQLRELREKFKRHQAEAEKDQKKYKSELEEMRLKLERVEAIRTPDTFMGALYSGAQSGAYAAGVALGAVTAPLLAPGYHLAKALDEWWHS